MNRSMQIEPDELTTESQHYERLWLQAELEKDKLAAENDRLKAEVEQLKHLIIYGS